MNIYTKAQKNSDFLNFKVKKKSNVTKSIINDEEIILKNNDSNKFLSLTKKEFFIWECLHEKVTIKDVIVKFFMKFGEFSRNYVINVIYEFYINGFLKKKPRNIFNEIEDIEIKKSFKYRIKKLSSFFFNFKIEIKNLDHLLSKVYNKFGFLFYTKPMFLLYYILSISGVIFFSKLIIEGNYLLLEINKSATLGSIIAIIINLFFTSIHEAAHAFTTKYYKKKVDRGGLVLYLGLPCFYVDTNEIWLAGKRARILVSLSGPLSTIFIGSVCAVLISLFPNFTYNDILFKISFWGFLSAIVNLNPLLELDGYYILIDYLKKPMLRSKSFIYLKETIKNLIFKKEIKKLEWDKIIYGGMASIWSFLSVVLVILIMEYRSKRIIRDFFVQNSLIIKIIGLTVLVFWMLPVILSIFLFVILKIKEAILLLIKTKIFTEPKYLLLILLLPILILVQYEDFSLLNFVAAGFLIAVFIYRFKYLNGSIFFLVTKINLIFYLTLLGFRNLQDHDKGFVYLSLVVFSFATFFILRNIKRKEIFLIYFLPILGSFFLIRYNLSALAFFFLIQIFVLESELKRLKRKYLAFSNEESLKSGGDLIKLKRVAQMTSKVLSGILFENICEKKKKEIVSYVKEIGFGFQNDNFVPEEKIANDIIVLSVKTKTLVSFLLSELKKLFGIFYSQKVTLKIFDSLFWSEKEIFDKFLFPEKDLMEIEKLSGKDFNKFEFLKGISLFSNFNENELKHLVENLRIQKFNKDDLIIKEGEEGEDFFIILEGEVEIFKLCEKEKKHITTLYDKDFLGEIALIKKCPRTASAAALRPSVLLCLNKNTFNKFLDRYPEMFVKIDSSIRTISFLKATPFFKTFSEEILTKFSQIIEEKRVLKEEIIISQNQMGNDFYIIKEGRLRVYKENNGKINDIAVLSRGEFFGEISLLAKEEQKASANICAQRDSTLYTIKKENFKKLISENRMIKSEFDYISSRRELENRYQTES